MILPKKTTASNQLVIHLAFSCAYTHLDELCGSALVGDPLELGGPGHHAEVLDPRTGHVPALHDWSATDLLAPSQRVVQVVDPATERGDQGGRLAC